MVKKRHSQKNTEANCRVIFSDWLYLSCSVSAVLRVFFRVPKSVRQYSGAIKHWSLFLNQSHFRNVKSSLPWSFWDIKYKKWHLIYFSRTSLLSACLIQIIILTIKIKAVVITELLHFAKCCGVYFIWSHFNPHNRLRNEPWVVWRPQGIKHLVQGHMAHPLWSHE